MPYYDNKHQCYRKIIVVNDKPTGALLNITKQINLPKLSPFKVTSNCCPEQKCPYAITNLNDKSELLCVNDIPMLFNYLVANGYTIDTKITKIMQNSDIRMDNSLLCFVSS